MVDALAWTSELILFIKLADCLICHKEKFNKLNNS